MLDIADKTANYLKKNPMCQASTNLRESICLDPNLLDHENPRKSRKINEISQKKYIILVI